MVVAKGARGVGLKARLVAIVDSQKLFGKKVGGKRKPQTQKLLEVLFSMKEMVKEKIMDIARTGKRTSIFPPNFGQLLKSTNDTKSFWEKMKYWH